MEWNIISSCIFQNRSMNLHPPNEQGDLNQSRTVKECVSNKTQIEHINGNNDSYNNIQ